MRRTFFIIIILQLLGTALLGQLLVKYRTSNEEAADLEKLLAQKIEDTRRLEILTLLAAHNLYKMDHGAAESSDLEKAGTYIQDLKELNTKLSGQKDALILMFESTLLRKKADTTNAIKLATKAVGQVGNSDNGYFLALAHVELARCYNSRAPIQAAIIRNLYGQMFKDIYKKLSRVQLDTTSFDMLTFYISKMRGDDAEVKLVYLRYLVDLFKKIGDKANEFWTRKEIGDIHFGQGKHAEAIKELLALSKEQQEAGNLRLCWTYDLLSGLYAASNKYDKAIHYSLEALKAVRTWEDSSGLIPIYGRIAHNYGATGSVAEAVEWNMRRLNQLNAVNQTYATFGLVYRITNDLVTLGRKQEALALIQKRQRTVTPVGNGEKRYMYLALSKCYAALGNNVMAERYIQDLLELRKVQILRQEMTGDPEADKYFATYYLETGKIEKAEKYFAAAYPSDRSPGPDQFSFMFRLDSTKGNYLSAIKHFRSYYAAKDSVFTTEKTKQIEELKIAYATEEKDSMISLNEQNINLLKQQDQLQKTKLRQGVLLRNIGFALAALLIIIVGLLFNRYRVKQRTNKQLQHLIKEKEWLLKEIHHRVKNNLQIVMSLLNSQSAYISNEQALNAIQDSQHRVQAMSLIHQKLYSTENVAAIDMSHYIRELVSYLADSFNTGERISFDLDIQPLKMDVSQAVPLGLILNEAITNAIKYAFPGNRKGVITISLSGSLDNHCLLRIADNGIGMPAKPDSKRPGSLGMSLMAGLSEDLEGKFFMENGSGTTINISFPVVQMMESQTV
jgi:two-component system, sensor histidine kinase PdtaS